MSSSFPFGERSCCGDALASLREHLPEGLASVVVVDNASGDGTAEMVAAEFPEVRLTRSRNLGFAAATNLGIAGGAAPFVLALNPDTRRSRRAPWRRCSS